MSEETLFRIGGVYRNGFGDGPWRLKAHPTRPGVAVLVHAEKEGRELQSGWEIATGTWTLNPNSERMHLIPGELHKVNGEWLPIDSDAEMLALQTRPQHEPASCEEEKREPQWVIDARIRVAKQRAADPTYERKRAPLAYFTEQQERARFDAFRDFVVTSDLAVESQPNTSFAGLTLDGCGAFVLPKQAW